MSLLALDSLPISHKITSFSVLPEGPLQLRTKLPKELGGPHSAQADLQCISSA